MAKKVLLLVLALVAILFAVIASRPATFEVKRSLLINAPQELVYDQVDDFTSWNAWSPWDKMDPAMKRTVNDVPSGVGAGYSWVGNKDVGEGNMKITEARPPEHLGLDLNFTAPFAANNRTNFDFEKTGEGTTVTWTMSGTNNFVSKAMSLFMDMDKMVGPDFERGLASMKSLAEAQAAKKAAEEKADAEAAAAPPPAAVDAAVDAGTP